MITDLRKTPFCSSWINIGDNGGHQQHRERLWLSPHCLNPATDTQGSLW